MLALYSIGKLDDPFFVNVQPDDTVRLVFDLSQGKNIRGRWNDKPEFEYVARPEPQGGLLPSPINPDNERPAEPKIKAKSHAKAH
jgi:Mn-containing catalase